jgi:hypothetical protein
MVRKVTGIIGIDEELRVYSGYDMPEREWYVTPDTEYDPEGEMEQASKEDKAALARNMIALWTKYLDEVSL